jgi:NADP-dependent 3-hydroxy acid dehydrogenase YdfG
MLQSLKGKVAWITGAGSGIGEGAAIALADAGMTVVLSGRRADKLADVAQKTGGEVLALDVADKSSVRKTVETIIARHRRIDVLVSSAGMNVKNRNWKYLTMEDWDQVIRIDLDGAFYCARAVLPHMIAQQDGLIINISSWAGKHVSAVTGPAYSAAKFGMNAMNESLNIEAGIHGVRAVAFCPGEVATPILDSRPVPPSAEDRARMVQPEDCGETIRFLAMLPKHVCINELTISPTWNRGYVAQARSIL